MSTLTALLGQSPPYGLALATLAVKPVDDPSAYGPRLTTATCVIAASRRSLDAMKSDDLICKWRVYVIEPESPTGVPDADTFDDFGQHAAWRSSAAGSRCTPSRRRPTWNDVGGLDGCETRSYDAGSGRVRLQIPGKEILPGARAEPGYAWIRVARSKAGRARQERRHRRGAPHPWPAVTGADSRVWAGARRSGAQPFFRERRPGRRHR